IVRSKLSTAAIMTAMIWIIFAGYISLLLLRPGFIQSIGHVAGRVPWWKAVGYPLLILSLLVLFTWKNMVETVWIGLTGRKWLESALGVGTGGLILGGIGAGLWIGFHPELLATAEAAIPWFVGLLLVIKLTS